MASSLFRSQLQTPTSSQQGTLKRNETVSDAQEIIRQIRNSANPQQMFNMMRQTNPLMLKTQELINYYGNGDAKTAVFAMAKAAGIDPSSVLSSLGLNG